VQTRTEGDGTTLWVNLDITQNLISVCGDDNVDGLNGSGERLVQVLLGDLQLKQSSVNLVDDNNWLDSLTKSLTQDGLGLDTDTFNTVNNDQSTISNTQSGGNLRGEVNVTWGIDQVNQERVTNGLLLDILDIIVNDLGVKGDGGRLDSDTTLLLILSGIGETSLTSLSGRDNTGTLHQGVGQSRFTVIDVGNDGHVTNVGNDVHQATHLINCEVHWRGSC
jgi:hypothetical protein